MFYTFVSSGCVGLLRYWIDTGMALPEESLAKCLEYMAVSYTHLDVYKRQCQKRSSGGNRRFPKLALSVPQYPEYFASVGLFSSNFIVKNEEDDYTELLSDPKAFQ